MEGIALRYWNDSCKGGGIVEHLIDFKLAEDRSAKGLLGIALSTLVDEHDISFTDGVVSNTFDGASVMSGEKVSWTFLIKGLFTKYMTFNLVLTCDSPLPPVSICDK